MRDGVDTGSGMLDGRGAAPRDGVVASMVPPGPPDPFAAAFGAARIAMVLTDPRLPDNPITYVNDAFCRLTGYERAEVVGRNCRFLQGPGTDRADVARLSAALAAGERFEGVILNRRKDGTPFWNHLVVGPVPGADGGPVAFFASQVDVTAEGGRAFPVPAGGAFHAVGEGDVVSIPEGRTEARLRELNETLEQRVEERTRALRQAEDALRQSQKMEAVGQLTGGLAHDFNNLLAGVSGGIDLARRRLSQGRVAEVGRYLDMASASVDRAAALTHRLLAFSRRQTLDPRPTDVGALVSGLVDLVRRTAGPSVAVQVVSGPATRCALVDPNQLENALLNLCINARDAMPDGGRLVISASNATVGAEGPFPGDVTPGDYVALTVTDTGSGMTPEVMARVFDPFFTTKPTGKGTGLGLSMIHGFAHQSGGHVSVSSEVGVGTAVTLLLPAHDGDAVPAPPATASGPVEAGRGETVLLVDDEATVRTLVTEGLVDLGYDVVQAAEAAPALAVLRSGARVDVLVTDVGLPGGMNGRQLADAARETRPDLKVLFLTGYAEASVIGEGVLGPDVAIIGKPCSIDDVALKVRGLIET